MSFLYLFFKAIFSRNFGIIKKLIELGVDPDVKCHGTPSLHLLIFTSALPNCDASWLTTYGTLLNKSDSTSRDDQGSTILHLIAEFDASECFELTLQSIGKEDFVSLCELKDRLGMKPIHKAVFGETNRCLSLLLSLGVNVNSPTVTGETPLHLAAIAKNSHAWSLLIGAGANPSAKNRHDRTPLDICNSHVPAWDPTCSNGSSSDSFIDKKPQTALLSHPLCMKHSTCPPSEVDEPVAPPENAKRLSVIIDNNYGILRASSTLQNLMWLDSTAATISDVLRVHDWSYIRKLQYACSQIGRNEEKSDGISHLDGDTAVSNQSFAASLHGAGAVCNAVDLLMNGSVKNAFCAVRPPGHHAGFRGVVPGPEGGPDSHGFCLLNNVSIGAAYALNVHREKIKRVAIIDFDVHHGNGTEETIRYLRPQVEKTEVLNTSCFGTFHQPVYKPWLDENDASNVMFVSVHGFGAREKGLEHLLPRAAFYPGTGATVIPDDSLFTVKHAVRSADKALATGSNAIGNVEEEKVDNGDEDRDEDGDDNDDNGDNDDNDDADEDGDDESYDGYNGDNDSEDENIQVRRADPFQNVTSLKEIYESQTLFDSDNITVAPPLVLDIGVELPSEDADDGGLSYRYQWRNYFREVVFPRLLKFSPDLIIISAGFDGHKKDTINAGYLSLLEEDFEWITSRLVQIANSTCEGRVISALEGGYQINGEFYSSFARSVKAHIGALIEAGRFTEAFDYKKEDIDRDWEIKVMIIF